MRLVVISDLHVGAGCLDDCDSELERELSTFFKSIADGDEPTAFVINGDFLDFAQAQPWQSPDFESCSSDAVPLCFTEEQSLAKLNNIIGSHQQIFDALSNLARSQAIHELTILPGNHDVDLFWPKVRAQLRRAIAGPDIDANKRLNFVLAQDYRPREFPAIWIEHGHQREACNRFAVAGKPCWSETVAPILTDVGGVPRLVECVGTRFLLKFMNSIDEKYPFVDNVKPFSKFVKMFLLSGFAPDFGPLKVLVACWALVKFLSYSLAKSPRDLLGLDGEDQDKGHDLLNAAKNQLLDLSEGDEQRLTLFAKNNAFEMNGMPFKFFVRDSERAEKLLDFLSDRPSSLDNIQSDHSSLLSAPNTGYLTLGSEFIADETAALKQAAQQIISNGLAAGVIMGHTHEPVDSDAQLNYVNTGSWTRYLRIDPQSAAPATSWKLLGKSAYENFPYELAYAEARTDAVIVTRKLFHR